MKRISIMILTSSAILTMLTACSKNENIQLELDPNMSISTITSYVSVEIKAPKEIPASEDGFSDEGIDPNNQ